jgi:hypothetical protein
MAVLWVVYSLFDFADSGNFGELFGSLLIISVIGYLMYTAIGASVVWVWRAIKR